MLEGLSALQCMFFRKIQEDPTPEWEESDSQMLRVQEWEESNSHMGRVQFQDEEIQLSYGKVLFPEWQGSNFVITTCSKLRILMRRASVSASPFKSHKHG